jgi:hypothetical protein
VSRFISVSFLARYGIPSLFIRIHGDLLKKRERCVTNGQIYKGVGIVVEEVRLDNL